MPNTVSERENMATALLELKAQAEQCMTEAQALDQMAEDEGRALTEDERAHFEQLMAKAIDLMDEHDEKQKEEQRAEARATLDIGLERFAQLPEATTRGNGTVALRTQRMRNRFYDDPKRGFAMAGDFYTAVYSAGFPGATPHENISKIQMEAAATGMSQGVGSDGGILVPPEFSEAIWLGMQAAPNNLLTMTDQYPVTGESVTFPASAETSRANGSRWGGVQGYWLAEAAQLTASRPKVRQMKLEPQELFVLVYVTDKLLRNASALDAYVNRASSEEITFMVNDAIINGNGVGMPAGVLNSAAVVEVAKETSQVAATVVIENINKMWSRMHATPRAGAVWLINQDVEPQLEALTAPSGSSGLPVFLPQGVGGPTITEAPNARLKGRPVLPVEFCQTLGTAGDIILLNLGYYATGIQGGLRADMSMHVRFEYAETAFRFGFAVDGQPWLNAALTPFKGTGTLSAYVTLADRA